MPINRTGYSSLLPVLISGGTGFIAISLSGRFFIKPCCPFVRLMAVAAPVDDFKFRVNLSKELAPLSFFA